LVSFRISDSQGLNGYSFRFSCIKTVVTTTATTQSTVVTERIYSPIGFRDYYTYFEDDLIYKQYGWNGLINAKVGFQSVLISDDSFDGFKYKLGLLIPKSCNETIFHDQGDSTSVNTKYSDYMVHYGSAENEPFLFWLSTFRARLSPNQDFFTEPVAIQNAAKNGIGGFAIFSNHSQEVPN
jgi:hypothetical protein